MDSKKFSLYDFEYELFEDGSLFVERESGRVQVLPKYVRIKNWMYPRYALYEKGFDFSEKNKQLIERYNLALAAFNESQSNEWIREGSRGEIVSSSIRDVTWPKYPTLYQNKGWRRFYINHASLVAKYWYWVTDEKVYPYFVDWNTYNLAVGNITINWWKDVIKKNVYGRSVSDWVINIILANCGRFSSPYIAKALDISETTVERVINWIGSYSRRWDRVGYAGNIRSSRWCFYNIVCYDWEIPYEFINRVLVSWSNDVRYQMYLKKWESRWVRRCIKWRMGFGLWVEKYWRDDNVSKVLMKKWCQLNSEFIDNVEELMTYIDSWSLWWDRCWWIERWESYMKNNLYRMPEKVLVYKDVQCVLQSVWVDNSKRTLWSLSDFQLVNAFDYCLWDFSSVSNWEQVISTFEEEPDFNNYQAHGYGSKDEFWRQYECLLWEWTIKDFREYYWDLLKSIFL